VRSTAGCGPQSGTAPVRIPISFWSHTTLSTAVGGFSVRPGLSLFQSPHRSEQVPKTGWFYRVVTHTHIIHSTLFMDWDLSIWSWTSSVSILLVRKWGLILPHPAFDAPGGRRLI
jgi:hypothetical protein